MNAPGCLDLETLTGLFASSIEDRSDIERHLDACSGCRELVAAYARASDDSSDAVTLANTPFARTMSSVAPPPRSEEWRAGALVGGRYVLDHVVGEGGMGVVWAARDELSAREVAIKILKETSIELARRSWREARAAAHVGHPSLLEVLDVIAPANEDAAPILVMPLLRGRSLDHLLRERGRLSSQEVISILRPVVSGMRAAHAKGVMHRDLKPQNVFLAEDPSGGAPVVLVLDFGLAKLLSDGSDAGADKLTRTGAVLGTPHYMAPEQLYGDASVDLRADVWAIGAIAFEALTGRRPIEGKSYGQIVKNAARHPIPNVAELAPDAPAPLASAIMQMLAIDRDARPPLSEIHALLLSLEERRAKSS